MKPELVMMAEEVLDAKVIKTEWPCGESYVIPAGLLCSICAAQDPDRRWKAYTTKRRAVGRRVGGTSGAVVILVEYKWLVLSREGHVWTENEDFVRRHKQEFSEGVREGDE